MEEYAFVIDVVVEIMEEAPPLLFDLTALQIEANRRYGMTTAEVLASAQALYEAELITYLGCWRSYLKIIEEPVIRRAYIFNIQ